MEIFLSGWYCLHWNQRTRVGLAMEEAIDDSVRGGVAEDERPPARREDDDNGLSTAQNIELADFLEESWRR